MREFRCPPGHDPLMPYLRLRITRRENYCLYFFLDEVYVPKDRWVKVQGRGLYMLDIGRPLDPMDWGKWAVFMGSSPDFCDLSNSIHVWGYDRRCDFKTLECLLSLKDMVDDLKGLVEVEVLDGTLALQRDFFKDDI